MALKRLRRIDAAHPFPVVRHADTGQPSVFDIDGDGPALRIQTIFDEFFDDGGGTLDDFAGGNPAHDVSRQDTNFSVRTGRQHNTTHDRDCG